MRTHHPRWLLPAALAWAMATATAQTASDSPAAAPSQPAANPLDASARVPALVYRSTLSSYRRLSPEKGLGWREANDEVQSIGGWRAYTREANAPEAAPLQQLAPSAAPASPAASTPTAKPMPAPPSGSHKH